MLSKNKLVPESKIAARIAYFGNVCWMCGGGYQCMDHVIPRLKGIQEFASNLRPACISCNSRKARRWTHTVPKLFMERILLMREGEVEQEAKDAARHLARQRRKYARLGFKVNSPYWDIPRKKKS